MILKGVIWNFGEGKEKSIKVSAYNQYVLIIWDVVASWDYIGNILCNTFISDFFFTDLI